MSRPRILFAAVNLKSAGPGGTSELALEQEFAAMERELLLARHRDFKLILVRAVTVDDMMRHLTELDPVVLHFAGHGVDGRRVAACLPRGSRDIGYLTNDHTSGIYLLDEQGLPHLLTGRALAAMIKAAAPSVRLLVLNACYSDAQAADLSHVVDCVITMAGAIGDDAARSFSAALYRALGSRRSVGNAFAQAVATLDGKRFPDKDLPRCHTRSGLEANQVFLTCARATQPLPSLSQELDIERTCKSERSHTLHGCLLGAAMALVLMAVGAGILSLIELSRHTGSTQEPVLPKQPETDRGPVATSSDLMVDAERKDAPRQAPQDREQGRQAQIQARDEKAAQGPTQAKKLVRLQRNAQHDTAPSNSTPHSKSSSLGDLDREIVQRYINYSHNRINYCYEKQHLARSTLTGTVTAQFLITPEGTVASSTASGLDGEVSGCVAAAIKDIEFPRSGSGVWVTYPFHFVPGDADATWSSPATLRGH